MQRSTFIIALFSLFALFSLALASPLPVRISNGLREAPVELSADVAPVDHKILHREVTDIESGVNLQILAREHESVQDLTDETNTARDAEDMEPRGCQRFSCL
jgi:hypothetical protein